MPLPEVIPLDETPAYVVGVANLRGQIVPLVDLNLRFGHTSQPYHLDDCVVVLEQGETVVGIIVNEVRSVRDVLTAEMLPVPSYGADVPLDTRFLSGLLQMGEQIVMLLHLENLLQLSADLPALPDAENLPSTAPSNAFLLADPRDGAVFRERALQLSQPMESSDGESSTPLVVVRLGEEFFGIALSSIREFSEVRGITPIPCCPDHIVGLMNLRGDLITVLDITGPLGLLPIRADTDRKIVVLNRLEGGVGVLVDEVLEVLTLPAMDMPSMLPTDRPNREEYRQGAAPYGNQMLSLLDLPALLMQQNLIVNETP